VSGLSILVVDDEKNIRTTLGVCLESLGCRVAMAATAPAAREWAAREGFDLAFVDLRLAEQSGLDLIPALIASCPSLDIVMITAYATVDTAVEAMKRGAREYLPKPFTPAQIRHLVAQVEERKSLLRRVRELEGQIAESCPEADMDSSSRKMQAALDTVLRAAASEVSVLLRGESGTGKGVLARAIHARSARAAGPFVVINCPTLSQELLASELFGHAKGAFTGAIRDNPGRVEAADRGTLFLDEIAEIPSSLQAKLLRFLQEREFERVGESRTRRADVRLVAATNRDLEAEVAAGRFREDLLYRLNVVEVRVPALRERPEDLLPLARRFVAFFAAAAKRPTPELSQAAQAVLVSHSWPGNVRELRNVIEHAVMLWPSKIIEPHAFPERFAAQPAPEPRVGGDVSLDDLEREHILRVLARKATLEEAAQSLGIDTSTLWRKRKKYGV
jgi:two-component system, NtrC family, response regulator AlgB